MNTIKYTLPAFLACYLINGDNSGFEGDEQNEIDTFLQGENDKGNIINMIPLDCNDRAFFTNYNDMNNLGGDCLEYTFECK
jgi:hypothetical protein